MSWLRVAKSGSSTGMKWKLNGADQPAINERSTKQPRCAASQSKIKLFFPPQAKKSWLLLRSEIASLPLGCLPGLRRRLALSLISSMKPQWLVMGASAMQPSKGRVWFDLLKRVERLRKEKIDWSGLGSSRHNHSSRNLKSEALQWREQSTIPFNLHFLNQKKRKHFFLISSIWFHEIELAESKSIITVQGYKSWGE